MAYSSRASGVLSDYAQLRTVPAALSVAFILASLYQFGGIATIDLTWLNYTLTTEHAVWVSIGSYVVAFASSETRQFENYSQQEQIAIVVGPAVILGAEYVTQINDVLMQLGDPLGYQIAFVASLASWAVATQ